MSKVDPRASTTRSALAFFAAVAVLSVPFWVLGNAITPPQEIPVRLPASALWLVAPLLAAGFLVARSSGTVGVARLLSRTLDWRGVRPGWLVIILLLSPAAYALSYAVMLALRRPLPEWQLSLQDLPVLIGLFLVAAVAEESGWTGHAADPLRRRWGATGAALVIGAVWALLHVVPDLQGGHDLGWIFWQRAVATIALRVIFVVVYVNTGSVFATVLMHTSENVSWQVFSASAPYDPAVTGPILAIAAVAVTVAVGNSPRVHEGEGHERGALAEQR